ncbi:MAG TPA: ATP-binding protein [Vicinamibacterales bacterium]|nr:ATP-binding protein [Vicinamibacterales bacterium]
MTARADAYPLPVIAAPLRYAVAFGLITTVFVLDTFAPTLIDDVSHFILLGSAVGATAWLAGTGPALAAAVLAAVLGAARGGDPLAGARLHLALFLVHCILLTAVVAALRRARTEAEVRARDAQSARRDGEAANRMKDEFLATISHELRTPLNSVLGWVHLLRTGRLDSPTSERGLESIDRNVRHQAQLTSDLLDVSRALTGKLRLESRPAFLDDAARQAVAAADSAAEAKGVTLTLSTTVPAAVHGDPTRLRQIAWHLIGNAIKFTPRDGSIDVAVGATGNEAWLTVKDSGGGISPEFLPRVFERFTQADSSATRTAGGLGVGLALVRELVELHGGEIEAKNRTECAGAIFTVRLPLQSAETVQLTPQLPMDDVVSAGAPPLDGLRVLVLDKNADGRELLRTILQNRGVHVQTVSSVADALNSLEAWRPDVLVSDSVASEHQSYALVAKVQSLESDRGGRIPAAALTPVARTDERMRGLLAGVQADVPKPVVPAVLAAQIARLTGRERRRVAR